MKMAVDEGRTDQPPCGVDRLARFGGDAGLDRDDAAARGGDVDVAAPVGERRAANEKVERHDGA